MQKKKGYSYHNDKDEATTDCSAFLLLVIEQNPFHPYFSEG